MAAKFTKHGEQVNSLTEMQAMWYEIECGHAHLRRRAYGKVRALIYMQECAVDDNTRVRADHAPGSLHDDSC